MEQKETKVTKRAGRGTAKTSLFHPPASAFILWLLRVRWRRFALGLFLGLGVPRVGSLEQLDLVANLLALLVLVEQRPERKALRERLVELAQQIAIVGDRLDQVLRLGVVHQLRILARRPWRTASRPSSYSPRALARFSPLATSLSASYTLLWACGRFLGQLRFGPRPPVCEIDDPPIQVRSDASSARPARSDRRAAVPAADPRAVADRPKKSRGSTFVSSSASYDQRVLLGRSLVGRHFQHGPLLRR